MGAAVDEGDDSPVVVKGGKIEMVRDFTYLGSKLSSDGEITAEVSCKIAKASKTFGCLRVPIFLHNLFINTKELSIRLGDFYFTIWNRDMDSEGS